MLPEKSLAKWCVNVETLGCLLFIVYFLWVVMSRLVQNQRQNFSDYRSGDVLMLSYGKEELNRAVRLNDVRIDCLN